MVPPVILGGRLAQAIGPFNLSAMVFDPGDQTSSYGLDGLFESGVNLSFSATWAGRLWGRAANLGLSYTYSSKDSVDLATILLAVAPGGVECGGGAASPHCP